MKVKVGDRLRVTDPQIWRPDEPMVGTVEGVDRYNGFVFRVDGDGYPVRIYYKANRKGTITVERIEGDSDS